jgi:Common central domain of tyrosinase
MALGDGIRRNIADVEPMERDALREAIKEMHRRYYPGSKSDEPPGGVSWWFKQDEIHQATHVHGGPEFLPWHRELCNRFEELLRQIDPRLSLHYWDFADDPTNIPNGNLGGGATGPLNLFDSNFFGAARPAAGQTDDPDVFGPNVDAGDPWRLAGFYDPQAGSSGHPPFRGSFDGDPSGTNNPVDPPRHMARTLQAGAPLVPTPTLQDGSGFGTVCPNIPVAGDNDLTSATTFPQFRVRLECLHNKAHVYLAAVSPHIAFRDPLVFLLHSNVDRIYAKWQTDPAHPERLREDTVYGSESNLDVIVGGETQNLTHNVEPWSSGHGEYHDIRPWEPTHENQGFPHTYHHISVVAPPCYDTNLSSFRIDEVENPLNAATNRYQVIFNDVPEAETTWRAAVIRVYTCIDTNFPHRRGHRAGNAVWSRGWHRAGDARCASAPLPGRQDLVLLHRARRRYGGDGRP